jgi:hypothetical protein
MTLSFNPQDIPVIGIDDHLPVDASELRSAALRRRCRPPPGGEIAGGRNSSSASRLRASVLVPLVSAPTAS